MHKGQKNWVAMETVAERSPQLKNDLDSLRHNIPINIPSDKGRLRMRYGDAFMLRPGQDRKSADEAERKLDEKFYAYTDRLIVREFLDPKKVDLSAYDKHTEKMASYIEGDIRSASIPYQEADVVLKQIKDGVDEELGFLKKSVTQTPGRP